MSREPSQRGVIVRAGDEVRGTQSFVQVMAAVFRRPSLTAIEIAWRWLFGAFALWLIGGVLHGILQTQDATIAVAGVVNAPWGDPMAASVKVGEAGAALMPPMLLAARWLVPVLFVAWVLASSVGRMVLLRRLDATLRPSFGSLAALGAIRLVFFGATVALWLAALTWSGSTAITGPARHGGEANLVEYFALVVSSTLLLFLAWAAASWVLSIAPVLAMMRGTGVGASLNAACRVGPLRGKLIEVNLVMGIVKVALIVLAMVFSASPLPFQTVTTPGFLHTWWTGVTLLYLLGSDYFHVVRLAAYLAFWRAYEEPDATSVRVSAAQERTA